MSIQRTIRLADRSAAELALGEPSWRSHILSVTHEHIEREGRGFVEVVSWTVRGVPVFLGSILGPQLLSLEFTLVGFSAVGSTANAQRRWRATYDGICRPGRYSLALRLLLAEFEASENVSLSQLVRQADYVPIVTPDASAWSVGKQNASSAMCGTRGFHWAASPPAALATHPMLDVWKAHDDSIERNLRHDPLPLITKDALMATMRAHVGDTLCFMGDSQLRNMRNGVVQLLDRLGGSAHPCDAARAHIGRLNGTHVQQICQDKAGGMRVPYHSNTFMEKILDTFLEAASHRHHWIVDNCTVLVTGAAHWDAGSPAKFTYGGPVPTRQYAAAAQQAARVAVDLVARRRRLRRIVWFTGVPSDVWGFNINKDPRKHHANSLIARYGRLELPSEAGRDHAGLSDRTYTCACGSCAKPDWRINSVLRVYREQLAEAARLHCQPVIDLLPQLEVVQELTMDGCHYQLPAIGALIAATALQATVSDIGNCAEAVFPRYSHYQPRAPPVWARQPAWYA